MTIGRTIRPPLLRKLGPGLIAGAADDDPSGIATYSQAGAQFGFAMLWTVVFTLPFMVVIQNISARIGRVTGRGLAANIHHLFPGWVLYVVVSLLLAANTINIAADIAAMGEALQLLVGGPEHGHAIVFGLLALALQAFLPYQRYVRVLKWLTLALFAYVAVVFTVHVPWGEVALRTLWPGLALTKDAMTVVVAVFGTTISPYMFFWQSSQEVADLGDESAARALIQTPRTARAELRRIEIDTYLGMGFSNLIAYFIILSAAVTLNAAGITEIQTSAQAAEALRPLGGNFAFVLFSLGIIGTGLLAVPVLAGSAAYAVAESFDWPTGLDRRLFEAKRFYGIVAFATVAGVLIDFTPLDPIKALFWSAVINGVIAAPIMAVMMLIATRRQIMGLFVLPRGMQILGWLATAIMFAAVVAFIVA